MSDQSSNPAPAAAEAPHEIAVLHQRINDIIAGRQQQKAVWYRNTSLITSVAAIFISLTTTAMSWYRTYQQDVTSLRAQLAATLQQANAVQIQFIEISAKYKNDQASFIRLSSALNTQNLVLAKQAYALARTLGGAASSVTLTSVASALMQSNEVTLAEDLLKQAVERSDNSVEYIAALRVLGTLQTYNGQRDQAENSFNKALEAFKIFPNEAKSQDYVNFTHAYTHLYWAQAVLSTDCQTTKQQLALVMQFMARLSGPARQQFSATEAEVGRMNQMVTSCG